jgi:hypothetical protein
MLFAVEGAGSGFELVSRRVTPCPIGYGAV